MADSVRERIIADIVAALQTVSIANGAVYDYPGGVQRFAQEGSVFATYPGIVVSMVQERKEYANIDLIDCALEIAVEVFAIHTDEIGEGTAEYVDRLAQDVEVVLAADPQRGGLCTDAHIVSVAPFGLTGGMQYVGSTISYLARYRHSRTDPSEAR